MQKILEEIAEEEGGNFYHEEEILPKSSWGASTAEGHHNLQIEYKGIKIRLVFTTQTHSIAHIEFTLPKQADDLAFEIKTRSPLMSLFVGNKNPISVKTQNHGLRQYLKDHLGFKQMCEKAKEYAFEPYIIGKNKANGFLIRTEFHLQFPERTEVVRPLIVFYKGIIDRFND